jgi:uncharacterized protein YcbX
VNAQRKMITQRSHSVLSKYSLEQFAGGWRVAAPDLSTIDILDDESTDVLMETYVWKDVVKVQEKSKIVSQWFSEKLDEFVMLVEFQDVENRIKSTNGFSGPLAFADGYPLLVCNKNSLTDLNQQLGRDLEMDRFRPNIVVSLPGQSEFLTKGLVNGSGNTLDFVSPCVRCNVPAIDQLTSAFDRDLHEALKQKLTRDDKTVFGMNAISKGISTIKVGDEFDIVK